MVGRRNLLVSDVVKTTETYKKKIFFVGNRLKKKFNALLSYRYYRSQVLPILSIIGPITYWLLSSINGLTLRYRKERHLRISDEVKGGGVIPLIPWMPRAL